jgi:hypothetical protein
MKTVLTFNPTVPVPKSRFGHQPTNPTGSEQSGNPEKHTKTTSGDHGAQKHIDNETVLGILCAWVAFVGLFIAHACSGPHPTKDQTKPTEPGAHQNPPKPPAHHK